MTLVILAAGMGSRFGGIKQLTPLTPNNEFIIDFTIYDAIQAGFKNIVFIIREEHREKFDSTIGERARKMGANVKYVYQTFDLPKPYVKPEERVKPWGTAHAISCIKHIDENFGVVNADDFYGRETIERLYEYLNKTSTQDNTYCLLGYKLKNTLSENGTVSRGICEYDSSDYLTKITEMTKIEKREGYAYDIEQNVKLDLENIISMNCFGFTPHFLDKLDSYFLKFLEENKDNLLKCEFFLPGVVQNMILDNSCKVKIVRTNATWVGVTYKEDSSSFTNYISELRNKGIYPEKLF